MIELRNLSKLFTTADGPVDALRHINLTIKAVRGRAPWSAVSICWKGPRKEASSWMAGIWAR